jgi:hypothetical protein
MFHRYANPARFFRLAAKAEPWLKWGMADAPPPGRRDMGAAGGNRR